MKALHSLHVFGFGQMRETHFTTFYYCITYTVNYECSFKASFHLTNKMDYPKMHKCSQIICIISFVEIVYEKVHNYLKVFLSLRGMKYFLFNIIFSKRMKCRRRKRLEKMFKKVKFIFHVWQIIQTFYQKLMWYFNPFF